MSAESVNRKKLLRVVVRYSRKILEASIHNDLHITYGLISLSTRKTNFKKVRWRTFWNEYTESVVRKIPELVLNINLFGYKIV